MRRLAILLPGLLAVLVAVAPAAVADSYGYGRGYGLHYGGRHHGGHDGWYRARHQRHHSSLGFGVLVQPRPVVYAPAPRIVYLPSPETYVILREGRDSQGHLCREFQRAGTIDGQPVQLYGVACLRPDGQWQIVN